MESPDNTGNALPIRVYERADVAGTSSRDSGSKLLAKFRVFLEDRPGSLAALSSLIAESEGNISFFHYDRSVHCNRVVVEAQFGERGGLDSLLQALRAQDYHFRERHHLRDELHITTLESVLEIKVRLINRPGSLAAFAALLKEHRANVTYMLYDDDIEPEVADIALATEDAVEIDSLLNAINQRGYHYRVVYRGSDQEAVDRVIGLNLLERFFLSLRKLLSQEDLEELRTVVEASEELCEDLVAFYSEAGNNLERGDVFANILALASMSVSKVGENFHLTESPALCFDDSVRLRVFQLPTGGSIFVFEHDGELTLFDAGYGLYYEDLRASLLARDLDPARIGRIFVSHADADHVGGAGYFADEFGAEVFLHPASRGVMESNNRAYGTGGALSELNRCFTRLVTEFTKCRYVRTFSPFSASPTGKVGGFGVIDTFAVGELTFLVLASHGGHIPGQVFFLNQDHGLLFTADYMINLASLSNEDKDRLSVPRYLMTSTNTNSQVFREESQALRDLALALDAEVRPHGGRAMIFPGHGDYYRADILGRG